MAEKVKDVLFICYSHTDTRYKTQFDKFLQGGRLQETFEIFSDARISPGENWQHRILDGLQRASAALLLISQDFMISPFIQQVELKELLASSIRRGLRLFLVPVRATTYEGTYLADFQWARSPDKPLSLLREEEQEQAMVEVCQLIARELGRQADNASIERSLACLDSIPKLDLPPAYELQGEIAEGEFARCFFARDRVLDEDVIVKVLHEELSRESAAYDKYVRSARQLRHPNIAGVLFSQTNKRPHFIVTPKIHGPTLRELVSAEDPAQRPSLESSLALTQRIARALQHAHEHGCVHGRLRPEEVRMDNHTGEPMLTGFRTHASMAAHASLRGKRTLDDFWYASPETRRDGRVDAKSDQYLLGLLAYELLAGSKPVTLDSWSCLLDPEIAQAIRAPRPLAEFVTGCSPAVSGVIMKALQQEPEQRWPNLQVFANRLEDACSVTPYARAKESYRLCAQNRAFYEEVYARLFETLPSAQAMFARGGLERQYAVLRDAVWLVLSYPDTRDVGEPTILSHVARSHTQRTPEEYEHFREAILAAVAKFDPGSLGDWKTALAPGFEYLINSLSPASMPGSGWRLTSRAAAVG